MSALQNFYVISHEYHWEYSCFSFVISDDHILFLVEDETYFHHS
jgi:hypothetical protein